MPVSSYGGNDDFPNIALAFWTWNGAHYSLGSLSTAQKGSVLT